MIVLILHTSEKDKSVEIQVSNRDDNLRTFLAVASHVPDLITAMQEGMTPEEIARITDRIQAQAERLEEVAKDPPGPVT